MHKSGQDVSLPSLMGRSVSNKLQVCEDWIVVPLSMFTLSGTCAACLSLHRASADKKLLVHPESRIAVSSVGTFVVVGVQSKDNAKWSILSSMSLAAPPHHALPHCTPPMVSIFVAAS
jgi:hypothetical protein